MASNRKRGIQPDDLYRLKSLIDVRVAPDGRRVAYTAVSRDKESDETQTSVYVAPLSARGRAQRFTQGKRDHSPRWSPDGRYLSFISNRDGKGQIYLAPLDGGEPRRLTDAKFGVMQPDWSPDGTRIAYVARTGTYKEPKERKGAEKNAPRVIRDLAYRLDGVGYFDERRRHVFVIDVETGDETQVTRGNWHDEQPAWSPDGRAIAFVSDRERERFQRLWRADLWVVSARGGRPRKLTRGKGGASNPQFSPDGRSIAFTGHEHGEAGSAKNTHLLVVPAEGGRAPHSLSAPTDRYVIGGLVAVGRTFVWSRDGKAVLFLAADRGAQAIFRAGAANGSVSKVLGGERQVTCFDLTPDGKRALFASEWTSDLPEVWDAALDGTGRSRNVSRANDELRDVELAPTRRIAYRAPDGLPVETFLMLPAGYKRGRRYSLALEIHGGPHGYHPTATGGAFIKYQALAAAGYAVLLPNPRGSQSYGEEYAHAVVGDWAGKDYEDDIAAVDLTIRRGIADPERLYVGGGSYGGYMTTWTVGHTDRFRAAVIAAPAADRVSMFGTTDIPLFSIYELDGTPWDNHEQYFERSPTNFLPNVTTPVMLQHSEGDLRCPISQSEEIFQGLKLLGKKVEFVRYPGGFHAVRLPSQEVDRVRRIIAWFDKHAPRRPARKRTAAKAAPSRNGARAARPANGARAGGRRAAARA